MKIPKEVVRIHESKKGQTTNYKMTNNYQHRSSPSSALSVIGAWPYERVQMSRTIVFIFSLVCICFTSNSKGETLV
jgi:hypothetical protein